MKSTQSSLLVLLGLAILLTLAHSEEVETDQRLYAT